MPPHARAHRRGAPKGTEGHRHARTRVVRHARGRGRSPTARVDRPAPGARPARARSGGGHRMGLSREGKEAGRDGEGDVRMPDLTRPRYGFSHTADSALTSLSRAGVAAGRITVKSAGPGWQAGRVVWQEPAPGEPLTADKDVKLKIAGEG